ncbi:hypothetical protein [Marinicella meishanensis]|uniref:hypothetical protein n=1 Tax=Marinicella meishanensis TaxID=2873263 RepID=UPI001CC07E9D|nr:hypothetical protein [Marinicella sp. NBU2979]
MKSNKPTMTHVSESEGTGISQSLLSESEGTGISQRMKSETEGTGIRNTAIVVMCLLVSNLALANSLHLFSSTESDGAFHGLYHDEANNQLHQIQGYMEDGEFRGISIPPEGEPKSSDDGTGNKSSDDGTGNKSSDDGTGNESSDDGTGGRDSSDDGTGGSKEFLISINLNCSSKAGQSNNHVSIEYMDGDVAVMNSEVNINGEQANCL